MKLRLLVLPLLLLSFVTIQAQDARAILDKASNTYAKAGGITADFKLESKDTKANATYTYDGNAYMKADRFKIEMAESTTWFDGKTQWVYIKNTEEVNITEPSGEELQGISPSALFSIYKKGFDLTYKGEKKVNGKTLLEVEMTPQKKAGDISKLMVLIDKATNFFNKITIVSTSGLENTLSIHNLKTGISLPATAFSFDKKDYPKVEIIDLR